jgi:hypothetical protein
MKEVSEILYASGEVFRLESGWRCLYSPTAEKGYLLGNSENQRAREEPELLDDPGLPLLGGFTLGSDRLTGSEVNTSPGLGALGQSG